MKKLLGIVIFICLTFFCISSVYAKNEAVEFCENRYVTLVNPVRGRELWSDKTLNPLKSQYEDSAIYKIPATWLMQYDALTDSEIVKAVKEFEVQGEKGVFMEVSKKLASDAGVEFDTKVRWSHPGVVFLSAYSQSERRLLIDTLYKEFKSTFGYYPESIGAWWFDSYSLEYIKSKYGLEAIMIVADQKTTDSYGVWGQWWGYPYIPSRSNVLVPAKGIGLGSVVIQWAQRDPVLAYGPDASFSNFSLQANDYIRNKKDTKYFESLASTYLNCSNSLGQITIGMETGMEALGFEYEYENQLKYLNGRGDIKFVTMSEFSKEFFKVHGKKNPDNVYIGEWNLNLSNRENNILGDKIIYSENSAFADYYLPDKNDFLSRNLQDLGLAKNSNKKIILFIVMAVSLVIFIKLNSLRVWLSHLAFTVASAGYLYRSGEALGWEVFYGFIINNIHYYQVFIYIASLVLIYYLAKLLSFRLKNLNLFLIALPLSFSIDGVLSLVRYSRLSEQHLIGIKTFGDNIFGVLFGSGALSIFSRGIPHSSQKYFYHFPFEKIFLNPFLYFIAYPLIHLLLAYLIYIFINAKSTKVKVFVMAILSVFYLVFLNIILSADPAFVRSLNVNPLN